MVSFLDKFKDIYNKLYNKVIYNKIQKYFPYKFKDIFE